jgi:hypothetical protein
LSVREEDAMPLNITSDSGSEAIREEVEQAIRAGLGDRVERGPWVATLRQLPQRLGYVVDLSNLNGFMRQWVFTAGDPVGLRIAEDLKSRGHREPPDGEPET